MQIPLKYLTQKFQDEHNVNKDDNGYVYVEIRKFMYGLKEAGVLSFNYVIKKLTTFGYYPFNYTAKLWKHESRKNCSRYV